MDKIVIKDLLARGIIGTNDWERKIAQDILINIIVFTNTRSAAASDKLEDCVDYRALANRARLHAETAERHTVEALANDLARLCLEQSTVERVIVRVEKPGSLRFSASAGVEVERDRGDAVP
jgi:FolB domain-containing protein